MKIREKYTRFSIHDSLPATLFNCFACFLALGMDGIALSGTFVPIYVIMEQIALKSGYSDSLDSLKLYIGILLNLVMSGKKSIISHTLLLFNFLSLDLPFFTSWEVPSASQNTNWGFERGFFLSLIENGEFVVKGIVGCGDENVSLIRCCCYLVYVLNVSTNCHLFPVGVFEEKRRLLHGLVFSVCGKLVEIKWRKTGRKLTHRTIIVFKLVELLHMTKSMCIAVQLSKFFSTIVNFIMSAF